MQNLHLLLTIFWHTMLISIPVIGIIVLPFLWKKLELESKGFNRIYLFNFLFVFLLQSRVFIGYIDYFLSTPKRFDSPIPPENYFQPIYQILLILELPVRILLLLFEFIPKPKFDSIFFPEIFIAIFGLVVAVLAVGILLSTIYSLLPIISLSQKNKPKRGFDYRTLGLIIYLFSWFYYFSLPDPYFLALSDKVKLQLHLPESTSWLNAVNCPQRYTYLKDDFKNLPKSIQIINPFRIDIVCSQKTKQMSFVYEPPLTRYWALSIIMSYKADGSLNQITNVKNIYFPEWSSLHIDLSAIRSWMNKQAPFDVSLDEEEIDKLNLPETIQEPKPLWVSFDGYTLSIDYGRSGAGAGFEITDNSISYY